MKKFTLIVLCVLSLGFVTGCATTNAVPEEKVKVEAPDWYLNGAKRSPDGIYAIGTSTLSDPLMAEKAARIDGRAALARSLETTVNRVVGGLATYDNDSKKYLIEHTKIVSNQVLVGSKQVDIFSFNGEVSVLMFLPYEDMLKQLKSAAETENDEKLKNFFDELTVEQIQSESE